MSRRIHSARHARVRIVIADDHLIIRRGLQLIISRREGWTVAAEAESVPQLLDVLERDRYDILITDLNLREQNILDVLPQIRRERPALPVLVLTSRPEAYAIAALRAGARGYISKDASADDIIDAIERVASGRQRISDSIVELMTGELSAGGAVHLRLSARELDVFLRLARGETPTRIAARLGISVKTVSTYRTRIMEKTGFRSNADMTAYAIRERLIE